MTTLNLRNSISRSPWRGGFGFLLIPLALACFALLPNAQAAAPELLPAPKPDGFYTGFNTAEGLNALFNVNTAVGQFNTALGFAALKLDTTGAHNTAIGAQALLNNNGSFNTAVGENALVHNTSGSMNMALGQGALANNLIGNNNTAMGFQALNHNTVDDNTAVGHSALLSNTTGDDNTATGEEALLHNTTANNNTAVGGLALSTNTIISNNTAVGWKALQFSNPPINSDPNTAFGSFALQNTTTGADNDAFGFQALRANIDGFGNAAHGALALISNTHGGFNAAFGAAALITNITGSVNTAVGVEAGANILGDWNIDIGGGVGGLAADSHTTRIGIGDTANTNVQTSCYIGGISGQGTGGTGIGVFVNAVGKLGTVGSSRRFKDAIKPMDKASEAILALKPVTFHYKQEIDPKGVPQFGLVAEDVEKVNPDLVARDAKGEVYSVRYDQVNAMLLNEFLKEHKKVQDLEKQVEALTAGLQKVSAQVEMSHPAPQMVNNNQ